jgi:hypothetical protein
MMSSNRPLTSGFGPLRRVAPPRDFGRKRGTADVEVITQPTEWRV